MNILKHKETRSDLGRIPVGDSTPSIYSRECFFLYSLSLPSLVLLVETRDLCTQKPVGRVVSDSTSACCLELPTENLANRHRIDRRVPSSFTPNTCPLRSGRAGRPVQCLRNRRVLSVRRLAHLTLLLGLAGSVPGPGLYVVPKVKIPRGASFLKFEFCCLSLSPPQRGLLSCCRWCWGVCTLIELLVLPLLTFLLPIAFWFSIRPPSISTSKTGLTALPACLCARLLQLRCVL